MRRGWIAAGVVVATAGGVGLMVVGPTEVTKMVDTLLSEPVTVTDDTRASERPGATRVVLLAFDGVGEENLERALRDGRMPRFAEVVGLHGGRMNRAFAVPDVLSILPSTTIAAWASVYTGVGVGEHGIAGNEQFNRETAFFAAPAPVSVSSIEHMLEAYNGSFVDDMLQAPTMFEQLPDARSHVSLSPIHRGADVYSIPTGLDAAPIFQGFVDGAVEDDDDAARKKAAAALDGGALDTLLRAIDEHGVPDLQVAYFPGIDLFTHVAHEPLAKQRDYLSAVVDPAIGTLVDRWRAEGEWEHTWMIVVSDHGHTPVLDDDSHSLSVEGGDEPGAVLEQAGFEPRPLGIGEVKGSASAVVAYQGAFAYIHLADRSACLPDCDWARPPRFEEDVMVVARAFFEANENGTGVSELEGTLDMVLVRRPRPTGEPCEPFGVFDGQELVSLGDYLDAHPRPDLLAFESRLRRLATGPFGHRAGDVLLMAQSGEDVPIEERYYFSGPYRSWHGSAKASDSRVPLVIAHGSYGTEKVKTIAQRFLPRPEDGWRSQRDVTPLVVGLLSTPREE